jgi:hypothetical protein
MAVSNVEKTLSVVMELPFVPVVLMENFLLLDPHQKMIVNMVNIITNNENIGSMNRFSEICNLR